VTRCSLPDHGPMPQMTVACPGSRENVMHMPPGPAMKYCCVVCVKPHEYQLPFIIVAEGRHQRAPERGDGAGRAAQVTVVAPACYRPEGNVGSH